MINYKEMANKYYLSSNYDYWELNYHYDQIKRLLDIKKLVKKGLFRKKPKTEVLNAGYSVYLIVK